MDQLRGRRTDPDLLIGLEALADVERELRPAAMRRDRAAVRPDEPAGGVEDDEVLADGDRRHGEPGGKIRDPGTAVLFDKTGNVVLTFSREDILRRAARGTGHGRSFGAGRDAGLEPASIEFRLVACRTLDAL